MQVVDIIYDKSNLNLGLDHIQHNTTPVSYSNGDLLEYNVSKNRFETNIDYKYSCYGVTGIKGFSFLALDFELVYNDVVEYLKDKTNLYIKYVG